MNTSHIITAIKILLIYFQKKNIQKKAHRLKWHKWFHGEICFSIFGQNFNLFFSLCGLEKEYYIDLFNSYNMLNVSIRSLPHYKIIRCEANNRDCSKKWNGKIFNQKDSTYILNFQFPWRNMGFVLPIWASKKKRQKMAISMAQKNQTACLTLPLPITLQIGQLGISERSAAISLILGRLTRTKYILANR